MLRIAIVDPNDMTRDPLRSLLLGVDFVFLEAESNRYEFFLDVIAESPPDVAIINLDADKTKSLHLIAQVVHDQPHLPILVLSSDNQAILQALQRGAKHFLTQPVVLEDMLVALNKARGESHASDARGGSMMVSRGNSQIVAILGSRGGVGCTTLGVNLGCTLSADQKNNVALIDLDLALGDADISLDLVPDHTLADLAMKMENLDLNFIKRTLLKHAPTGLNLLAHPMQMSDIGEIQPAHVERVLNLLRINYSHLILDLSKGLSPIDLVGLEMADTILMVAQLELSSLRNVVRMLMSLNVLEGVTEKVRVIVNRVGSEFAESEISLKKAEETIGKPIFWQVPNDARPVMGAKVAGEALITHAPRCRAQQSIAGLAMTLSNKVTAPAPEATGGFFKSMFGKK